MNQNYLIYKFTSPSGKSYIGQTNNLIKRFSAHRRSNVKTVFCSAIKKYGFDNFTHEILKENLNVDDANYWEEFFIKNHNTIYPFGYNLHSGGRNHVATIETKKKITDALLARPPMSDKTKAKMSESRTGNKNPFFGKKHSELTKQKMSNARKNRKEYTDEQKLKISQAISTAHKGKKRSAETIEKIKISNTGKKRTKETCEKLSECRRNISDETRRKMSESAKKRQEEIRMSKLKG